MTVTREAREWLKNLSDGSAFVPRRFHSTGEALDFVYKLYRAGAVEVRVPAADPRSFEVSLPTEALFRDGVLDVCNVERAHCGTAPVTDQGQTTLRISWEGIAAPARS